MAYIPKVCEPFSSSGVLPGWICCECGYFNGIKHYACRRCRHATCAAIELKPEVVKATQTLKQARKKNLNTKIAPGLNRWASDASKKAAQPKYLTAKKRNASLRDRAVVR